VSLIRSVFSTHQWCRCELPTSSGGRFVLGGFFFCVFVVVLSLGCFVPCCLVVCVLCRVCLYPPLCLRHRWIRRELFSVPMILLSAACFLSVFCVVGVLWLVYGACRWVLFLCIRVGALGGCLCWFFGFGMCLSVGRHCVVVLCHWSVDGGLFLCRFV